MTPESLAALVSIPAALAVIVTAGLFLKHIAGQRTDDRLAYAEQRALDRTLVENHLTKSIEVQAQTVVALAELVTSIKIMQATNDTGMAWVRDGMAGLIRAVSRITPKD